MGIGNGVAAVGAGVVLVGGLVLAGPSSSPEPATEVLPRAEVGTEAGRRVTYGWPSGEPVTVVRGFTAPPEPWAAGHRGVDLAMVDGAPVRAAADGVVAFAGMVAGRGVVSIDHADGVRTTYEPVTAAVSRGASVAGGDVIGQLAGPGHCDPATCLHWGARRGSDDYLDPMTLLEEEVVIRLLPHHRS